MTRRFWALAAACVAFLLPLAAVTSPAGATSLPGGRGYYVVSLAHLDTSTPSSNWVRLAFYRFDTSGNAYEGFWYYPSSGQNGMTTVISAACPSNCPVYSEPNFANNGPQQLTGTYAVSGSTLTINWSGGAVESWGIVNGSGLTRLNLNTAGTSYPTTYGRGYGSTSDWNTGTSAQGIYNAAVANATSGVWTLPGDQYQWAWQGPSSLNTIGASSNFNLTPGDITVCTTNCFQMDDGTTTNYMATLSSTLPRKLTREQFKDSLKQGAACYVNGHPHLWQALEIIDDSGNFRGWVSTEVSLWSTPSANTDYMSVAWYAA